MSLSDTFWLSLAGIIAGVISGVLIYINKSKCSSVSCCYGLVVCVRNVEIESKQHEFDVIHGVPSTPTLNSI